MRSVAGAMSSFRRLPRNALVILLIVGLSLSGLSGLSCQEAVETPGGGGLSPTPIPRTYEGTEPVRTESRAGAAIWRATIIAAGAFPFAYFYSNFIFDSVRFAGSGFDTQYAPWPMKTQFSAEVSTGETFARLGVSLGLCAVVGILDALIPGK